MVLDVHDSCGRGVESSSKSIQINEVKQYVLAPNDRMGLNGRIDVLKGKAGER